MRTQKSKSEEHKDRKYEDANSKVLILRVSLIETNDLLTVNAASTASLRERLKSTRLGF